MEELTNGLKKDYGSLGRTNESKRKEAVRNDKRTIAKDYVERRMKERTDGKGNG